MKCVEIVAGLKSRNVYECEEFDTSAYLYALTWLSFVVEQGQTLHIRTYKEETIINIIAYFEQHFYKQKTEIKQITPVEIYICKYPLGQNSYLFN